MQQAEEVMAELWAGPLDGSRAPMRPRRRDAQPVICRESGKVHFYTLITDPDIDEHHWATFHHNERPKAEKQ